MALSREEFERIRRLQRQLDARSRLETERALFRLLKAYDALGREIEPLRIRALEAVRAGRFDDAEKLADQMDQLVAQRLTELEPDELAQIGAMIERAALRGAQVVDLAPLAAVMPNAGLDDLLRSLEEIASTGGGSFGIGVRYGEIQAAVKDRIQRKVYEDGLNLSKRLHTRLAENREAFNQLLSDGLKEGRGAIQLGKQLATLDVTSPKVPRYLRDLQQAVKGPGGRRLVDEVRTAIAEAAKRKNGPLGIGGISRRVVKAAQTGSAQRIDQALDEFLQRKARYHAIVIARTEANDAFRTAHVERAQDTPWVRGIAWHTSASHARHDECDTLATQDLYGLGPGVYPPERLPELPHPSDMCFRTDAVDLNWFDDRNREAIENTVRAAPQSDKIEAEISRLLDGAPLDDRLALERHLLDGSGMAGVRVAFEDMRDRGYAAWDRDVVELQGRMQVMRVALQRNDQRPDHQRIKTAFHEFTHARMDGADTDMLVMGQPVWLRVEETVAEAVGHHLTRRAGIIGEISPAYSNFLIDTLPRLKRLPGFEQASTIADFGKVLARYRFGESPRASWGELAKQLDAVPHDVRTYAEQYRSYVAANLDDIAGVIAQNQGESSPELLQAIKASVERGWRTKDTSEQGFIDSLLIAMNRLGVR